MLFGAPWILWVWKVAGKAGRSTEPNARRPKTPGDETPFTVPWQVLSKEGGLRGGEVSYRRAKGLSFSATLAVLPAATG